MGLKTTNYKVEKFNHTLEEAYAYIIDCTSDRIRGQATIGIFASREDAENPAIEPYEAKKIKFIVDRSKNDRETAYNTAKSQYLTPYFNPKTGKVEQMLVDNYFVGWQDDILD